MTHLGDGNSELLFKSLEKEEALMSAMCWTRMGEKPFEDSYMTAQGLGPDGKLLNEA